MVAELRAELKKKDDLVARLVGPVNKKQNNGFKAVKKGDKVFAVEVKDATLGQYNVAVASVVDTTEHTVELHFEDQMAGPLSPNASTIVGAKLPGKAVTLTHAKAARASARTTGTPAKVHCPMNSSWN